MRKFWLLIASIFITLGSSSAQHSLSFYHLGNATFQNSYYNPAFIPEGRVFFGLPVMSGIHLNFNNKFDYSDVIVSRESGNQIDLNRFLNSLQRNNMVSTTVGINLFHLGISTKSEMTFSIFANERIEFDFLYPRSLMEFVIDGNASLTGDKIKIGKTRVSASHFREIGLGWAANVPKYDMTIGVHAKYLQGFFNASTPGNFRANLETNSLDYSLDLEMKNATLRTSGFDIADGSEGNIARHLIGNSNRGAAIDLGFNWDMNRFYTVSASLVDIGFISWKENITNYTVADTTMNYSGIDLKDIDQLEQTVQDSLIDKFENRQTENNNPYTSWISPKLYVSSAYHTPIGGDFVGSLGTRLVASQLKFMLGVGYRQPFGKFFVGSVNVTRLPQQFLNLGAALAIKGGPAQMYLAVDQLVNYDATKFKAFDFRFGINFIIGERREQIKSAFDDGPSTKRKKPDEPATQLFLGSKVKAKGKDGIYTIIKKQERRKKKEYILQGDPIPKLSNDHKIANPNGEQE